MGWARHVVSMEEKISAFMFWCLNLKGIYHFEALGVRRRIVLK
jgi:hypothetical protein